MICRACGSDARRFLDLGRQPLANRFLTQEMLGQPEPMFSLEEFFCPNCALVQLGQVPDPKDQFTNYAYASSTSASFRKHFEDLADKIVELGLEPRSLVVEIGSNDGVLLRPLEARNFKAIGVEPAENLAKLSQEACLTVRNEFFDNRTVLAIGPSKAQVIIACNVFAHVPNLAELVKDIHHLLSPDGIFICEVQSMKAMLDTNNFDNCYSEHVFTWSVISLSNTLARWGLRVFRVEQIPSHGGSLRVYADKAFRVPEPSVANSRLLEANAGMMSLETYEKFGQNVQSMKDGLRDVLATLSSQGAKIYGYGAPAKSSTLNSFIGIGPELVKFIVDDSPLKQGLFTPGAHIPVVSAEILKSAKPDYLLIYAWNFFEPIRKATSYLRIPYILPIPPQIVQP